MIESLYDKFKHWSEKGSVYLYSDPHFGDKKLNKIRKITDEWQIKQINKVISNNDTIIFLGDIGDLNCLAQIRGYKVLIMGNHEKGASNYKRKTGFRIKEGFMPTCPICGESASYERNENGEWFCAKCGTKFKTAPMEFLDNHLFDEVYEGVLQITDKIILSHYRLDPLRAYEFDIHGHDHYGADFLNFVLKDYDADMPAEDMTDNYIATIKKYSLRHFNVCAEWINYTPVNLTKIIKSGILSNIIDIHRANIDKAIVRKAHRQNKQNKSSN